MPHEKTGMTGVTDGALFEAIKAFQIAQGLTPTGAINPGDATAHALNNQSAKDRDGRYIWRCVGDDKVRPDHAALDGTTRDWHDSPDPGEDINCRCWAELVSETIEREQLTPPKMETPKVPGTDIPDRGIPEQGWPGSRDYDPFKPKPNPGMDPNIIVIPPSNIGPNMPVYEDLPWKREDKSI